MMVVAHALKSLPLVVHIFLPILWGLVCFMHLNRGTKILSILIQVFLLGLSVFNFEKLALQPTWIEPLINLQLPLGISLRLDYLSGFMLLLSNFLFLVLLVFNFNKRYMDGRFFFLFLALQGLINGVFLSNDLFNLYLLIEIATIVVSVLIMYKKDAMAMYDGMIYLLVNMVAMALFLFGIAFIYKHFGRFDMSGLERDMLQVSIVKPLYLPFAMMLTAGSLKAALLPLYSWLPKAHSTASAPSVVSAVLSGIFVKTGVYVVLRLTALFDPAIDMGLVMQILGFGTAIFGFILALSQKDIKAVLAYHTVSQVGLMFIGFYSGDLVSYIGGLLHLANHVVFKSLLFLMAGILVDHYRTRELEKFGGFFKISPLASTILVVAIFSITGAPLFSGSLSKALIAKGFTATTANILLNVISFGTILSFAKVAYYTFRKPRVPSLGPKSLNLTWNQWGAIIILASACILLGNLSEGAILYFTGVTGVYYEWWQPDLLKSAFFKKGIPYIGMTLVAFPLYEYVLSKSPILGIVRRIDLSYNSIMMAIVLYLAGWMSMLYLFGSLPATL